MNDTIRATLGPTRLAGRVGEGGMGMVNRAEDPRLSRRLGLDHLPLRTGGE